MSFRPARNRWILFLSAACLAAGVAGDAPSIQSVGAGVFALKNVPAGGDLTETPETRNLVNGLFRRESDLTSQGDRGIIYRSTTSPSQVIVVSPEYESSPAQTSGGRSAASDLASKKTCIDEEDAVIPELPEPASTSAPRAPSLNPANYVRIADLAEDSERISLVDGARQLVQNYQNHADEDLRTLTGEFQNLPPEQWQRAYERAAEELRRQYDTFDNADRSSMLPGERLRFRNALSNAIDKAEAAAKSGRTDALPSLQAAAGREKVSGLTADALSDRMVLLAALPSAERKRILSRLRLVETPVLNLKNGKKSSFAIPHNGYWLGGSKTGTDCSGFASESLPAEVRKLRFTTLDFRTIFQLARTGRFSPPPRYEPDRLATLKEISKNFEAVQPHLGESLKPFDLLVYRLGAEPSGHVFIVEKYDPNSLDAQVLEASQSYGGLRSRSFNLSLDPRDAPHRILRPGIFALRLKRDAVLRRCSLSRKEGGKS
jgi:hypothetical protein